MSDQEGDEDFDDFEGASQGGKDTDDHDASVDERETTAEDMMPQMEIPEGWLKFDEERKVEPSSKCKHRGGEFESFKRLMGLYKPVDGRADYWHICLWRSREVQGYVYCDLLGTWRKDDSGTMSNHVSKGKHNFHRKLKAERQHAISKGFTEGRVMPRNADEDPRLVPLYRWVPTKGGASGGGGAAAAPSSSSSLSILVDEAMNATTGAAETMSTTSGGTGSSFCVPPGYDNHFAMPAIRTEEQQQLQLNYVCGMIARDVRPISITDGDGYKAHAKALRSNFVPPCYRAKVENLRAMQLKRLGAITADLRKTRETVTRHFKLPNHLRLPYLNPSSRSAASVRVRSQCNAWSADLWKRRRGKDYLSIATHSLTHDFVKKDHIVFFREFDHRHLGDNLGKAFDTFHAEIGLDGSFFEAAVLDGGSDIQKGARVAANRPVRIDKCSVHTLQRVVIQGVNKAKCLIGNLQSTASSTILPIKRLLKRGNRLVKLCKSGRPNKALTEAIRIKKLSARQLVRANATRWSSFYDSLNSILELREAIELMIALDKERAKKRKKDGVFRADQLKDIEFNEQEWDLVNEIVEALFPFSTATNDMQSDKETASLPFPLIMMINKTLQPGGHIRRDAGGKRRRVEEKYLSVPIKAFRKQLLEELKQRFKFVKGGLSNDEREKIIHQFVIPAFLTPKHRDLRKLGVGVVMEAKSLDVVKKEMKAVLHPFYAHLDDKHRQWLITKGIEEQEKQRKRNAAAASEGGGGGREPKKRKVSSMTSSDIMDLFNDPEDVGAAAVENETQEEEEATLPSGVIDAIIDAELKVYEAKAEETLALEKTHAQEHDSNNALKWWKSMRDLGELPILSVVAAKYLCVPASSATVERVFSQAGLIDAPLRNRLGSQNLETLVFLKVNWDTTLYGMTCNEKRTLLREWKKRATAAGVNDPTDRTFGIEEVDATAAMAGLIEDSESEDAIFNLDEESDKGVVVTEVDEEVDAVLSVSESEGCDLSSDDDSDAELQS